MALRPILIHPDPRLKKLCEPVGAPGPQDLKLAEDMLDTMYDAPGIGLAAPQIGILRRVFVMDCAPKEEPPEPIVLFDPEITWRSEELNVHEEGCLSIPDVFENVTRPDRIRLSWTDRDGARQEAEWDGLRATCAQHEIDHLDGKLFIDYLGAVRRTMITTKMKKLKKQRA